MRKLLVQFLTKNVLGWVSEEDILSVVNGRISHRGHPLTKEQASQLSDQAKTIRGMYLWKVLSDETKYVAQEMFIKAKNYDETVSARLLLRAMEVLDKRLASLSTLAEPKE